MSPLYICSPTVGLARLAILPPFVTVQGRSGAVAIVAIQDQSGCTIQSLLSEC